MSGALASLFCKLGWHGKDEDRVIHSYTNGVQLLATHCSRCGHCYVDITPAMWPRAKRRTHVFKREKPSKRSDNDTDCTSTA